MARAEFGELHELEGLCKCGICQETFNTPVLTQCSHSFCSLCIRKWLTTKAVCPACSSETHESSLRKNTVLENIIEALERVKKNRKGVVAARSPQKPNARAPSQGPSNSNVNSSNKLNQNLHPSVPISAISDSDTDDSDAFIKTRPSTSKISPKTNVRSNVPKETPPRTPCIKPQTTALNQSLTPKVGASPAVVKVACPVCSVEMPQRVINEHLDKCLSGGTTRSSVATKVAATPTPVSAPSPKVAQRAPDNSSNLPLEPIKKMVYNLMPDAQLRKELKKYGLPTQGDRKCLAGRMQRYVVLHNAECDATNPRTLEELRKYFEKEERALSGPSNTTKFSSMFKTKQPDEDEFDKARKEYIRQNNSSFQNLIEQCRNRNKSKTKEQSVQPVTLSDSEDDPEEVPVPTINKTSKDSDSDSPCDDVQKTPHHKSVQRPKRKVLSIDSDTEDETDFDGRPEKRPSLEGNTSPVLVSKTPVKRELRNRVVHAKVAEKPQRRSLKPKQAPKKEVTKAVVNKASPMKVIDSEGSDSLFDTPSSADTI